MREHLIDRINSNNAIHVTERGWFFFSKGTVGTGIQFNLWLCAVESNSVTGQVKTHCAILLEPGPIFLTAL